MTLLNTQSSSTENDGTGWCIAYGDFYSNQDLTANQACCGCGGGRFTGPPTTAPTVAAIVSSAVVVNSFDPLAFNSDTAAQSAMAISLVSAVERVTSVDQVTNLFAELYLARRTTQSAKVSFDLILQPTAGQDASQLQTDLVSQLTGAVSSGPLATTIAANTQASSALSSATINEVSSTSIIQTATIVVTQAPKPPPSVPGFVTPLSHAYCRSVASAMFETFTAAFAHQLLLLSIAHTHAAYRVLGWQCCAA